MPEKEINHTDNGVCPACLMPARVALHKNNGFYSACRHCGSRLFTSTTEGALVFKAMQRAMQDPDILSALKDALAAELTKLEIELMPKNAASRL